MTLAAIHPFRTSLAAIVADELEKSGLCAMDARENFFNDPKLWIAFASLVVSICSAIYSGRKSSRALAISESQERRRQPQLGIYLANAYRRITPKRQLFGFLVS